MCLIALSVIKSKDWNGKDSYFFKVVANRDEYHERQTTQMHWWSNKLILAGKDELAGGTWSVSYTHLTLPTILLV